MRKLPSFVGVVMLLLVAAGLAAGASWILAAFGINLALEHLVDAMTGAVCLAWSLVLLRAPWDLLFEARAVAADMRESRARGITVDVKRETEVLTLARRLLWIALGAHVVSAGLALAVSLFSHGPVGLWFAAFYALSTIFRPAAAVWSHLKARLHLLRAEIHYPREDVLTMREAVERHGHELESAKESLRALEKQLAAERESRARETRELRDGLLKVSRETETALARMTDNQDVLKGIQAFVRLIGQSAHS
ncbi:MAG TPA: hypothetical protein VMV18_07295 [bacterium]|nr:hypothetical protein [bacterium]